MLSFFRSSVDDKKLVKETGLSAFVRSASSSTKKQVYNRVISQATAEQKAVMLKLKHKK